MKRFYVLLFIIALLAAGCVGMSGLDGSSTKRWVSIISSKRSLNGDVQDICYVLDLKFVPEQATQRINTDYACITRCCWYSEYKSVSLRFNDNFAKELEQHGSARKYKPDTIEVNLLYSNLLKTIHAKANPKAIKYNGVIILNYTTVVNNDVPSNIAQQNQSTNRYGKQDAGIKVVTRRAPRATVLSAEEQEALQKRKTEYEKQQAVILLKRFYNQRIDSYITFIDKSFKARGEILLTNERQWAATQNEDSIYNIACGVNGKIGRAQDDMRPYPFKCGMFTVNLVEQTVKPKDALAKKVLTGKYK